MNKEEKDNSWSISLDHEFKIKMKPFETPRLKQALLFVPFTLRYIYYRKQCQKKKIEPHMDFFSPIKCNQIYGAPIGGIGSGSIGRSFMGDFCRYQLVPGIYEHEIVEANNFTVCIRKKSSTVYQQTLSTRRPKAKGLKSWNMMYSGENATYHALYPQSWTIYRLPGQNVNLTCHQMSPVIAHNYKDSSLPVGLFSWTVENNNKEDIELSLMFTWQSGSASDKFELTDVSSRSFERLESDICAAGVIINQKLNKMPLQFCVAAQKTNNCEISYNCHFYPDDEDSGSNLWLDLLKDGRLDNTEFDEKNGPSVKNLKLAIAVCVKVRVAAHGKENINFSLVWNMPKVSFGDNTASYKRFYTRYFCNETTCSQDITCYSLSKKSDWVHAIREWQRPILENENLPSWYRKVIFNELYFVSDGGTVWFDMKDDPYCRHNVVKEYGRFAYLEGHEYRMYNTYDVHFNASFALLQLWPKLQLSLQYEFSDTIQKESENTMMFLMDGKTGKQKTKNTLPHDIGDPYHEPWLVLNAYNSHNTITWKDLNLKFILSVYRDFYYLKDFEFLQYMWPFIKTLMVTVQSQDHDKDGLIDSEGHPDQTYDAWCVSGASAYCGGLHVATLKVVCEIAQIVGDKDSLENYSLLFEKAKRSYDTKLWNGKYYNYDCSNSDYNDSIMTDMCCGHWFLRCSGFEYEGFEKEKVKSCLETIFEYNVMKYQNGKAGSVNGMRPNGQVDITSMQSEEMWIGVTDSLASLMIFEGMKDKAWHIIENMYSLLYDELGLSFQIPEALLGSNQYRSLGYMRALCIWSIQYSINQLDKKSYSVN